MQVQNLNGVCTTNINEIETSCIRGFFSNSFDVIWEVINEGSYVILQPYVSSGVYTMGQ